jgi:hypothetical protein
MRAVQGLSSVKSRLQVALIAGISAMLAATNMASAWRTCVAVLPAASPCS